MTHQKVGGMGEKGGGKGIRERKEGRVGMGEDRAEAARKATQRIRYCQENILLFPITCGSTKKHKK